MVQLINLNLSFNEIEDISVFSYLTKLINLDLSFNKIINIERLVLLKKLKILNLGRNKIESIESLTYLIKIEQLYLENNQIKNIDKLASLKNLTKLWLYSNQIEDIFVIKNFIQLKTLILNNNKIKDISAIENLKNLKILFLSDNEIENISSIKNLINLIALYLSNNQIQDISMLSVLINIEELYLDNNQIINIESLKYLTKLNQLNLSNNQIAYIPTNCQNLLALNTDKGLNLHNNSFFYTEEIFDWEPKETLAYIWEAQVKKEQGLMRPLHEVKVMFVGDSNYGKTHLIDCLMSPMYQLNRCDISSTHGIERNRLLTKEKPEICLNLWDLGGQQFMRNTHQIFFTERTVYVLVTIARVEQEGINHWMQQIQQMGGKNVPVIIVVNKIDEKKENEQHQIDEAAIRRDYPKNICAIVYTSIYQADTIENLYAEIYKIISDKVKMRWIYEERTIEWLAIKKEVEEIADTKKETISYHKFEEICEKNEPNISPEKIQQALKLLNTLGTVVAFVEDRQLMNTPILNPQWILDAVYALINNKQIKDIQKGRFSLADLSKALQESEHGTRFGVQYHAYLIDLLEKFLLCYPSENGTYLYPSLFESNEPNYDWEVSDCMRFRYDYGFIKPDSIICQFIVKNYRRIANDKLRWANGVYLNYEETGKICTAKIYRSFKGNNIDIEIQGEKTLQRTFLNIIRDSLDFLSKSVEPPVKRFYLYKEQVVSYEDVMYHVEEKEENILIRGYGRLNIQEILNNFELPKQSIININVFTEKTNIKESAIIIHTKKVYQIENYIKQNSIDTATTDMGKLLQQTIKVFEGENYSENVKDLVLDKIAEILREPQKALPPATLMEKASEFVNKVTKKVGTDFALEEAKGYILDVFTSIF